jgi:hypothetical protein
MRALSSAVFLSLLMASPALADSSEIPAASTPDIAALQAQGAPASDEQLEDMHGKNVGNMGKAFAGSDRPAWFDNPDPNDKDTRGVSLAGFPVSGEDWNEMTENPKGKPKPPAWVSKPGAPAGWNLPGLSIDGLTQSDPTLRQAQVNDGGPPAWFAGPSVPTGLNVPGLSGGMPGANTPGLSSSTPGIGGNWH